MTCIVGIIDKKTNKVIIGGDSAGVSGLDITIRSDPKVFKNKGFVFGCTSSFRMIQLLRFSFKPPAVKRKDLYEYMCTDFIDAVRKCFKDGGYLQKYDTGDEKGGAFLVAYKNRLFFVDNDFQVGEPTVGYDACGCGEDFAKGVLFAQDGQKVSADKKLLNALNAAEFLSGGVRRPFVFAET